MKNGRSVGCLDNLGVSSILTCVGVVVGRGRSSPAKYCFSFSKTLECKELTVGTAEVARLQGNNNCGGH